MGEYCVGGDTYKSLAWKPPEIYASHLTVRLFTSLLHAYLRRTVHGMGREQSIDGNIGPTCSYTAKKRDHIVFYLKMLYFLYE